jgi:non-specific serine/threonine protein kinase
LTSFVGREGEIAHVAALVQRERMVTLVGAPGVGKTRLCSQVALGVLEAFPDGAWLIELAPLSDPELVPRAVADVLGVRAQPGRSLTAALAGYLRTRRLVLLLDNCEHLIGAAATLAESLLQTCPGLHILATSREPLTIEGERTHRVPSLPDAEAARLFADRARVAAPAFGLTERTEPIVGQICARLDGIPLAIELAAARVRALSPEQIAARLDDRFRLLTGGSRTALPRQQTLRGAVEWSYDLLSAPEQALLRRLAVFAGGFTLEAASWVMADQASDIFDLLVSLVDKSLVQAEEAGDDGERRYRLLETLREYGLGQLAEHGELDEARDRHRNYFLTFAETAEPHLTGPGVKSMLAVLEREHDNLRAALGWCLDRRKDGLPSASPVSTDADPDLAVRLAGALYRFWWMRGHPAEGRRWLERALAVQPFDVTPDGLSARATACMGTAHLCTHLADYQSAIVYIEDALRLWRQAGNDRGTATGLQRYGVYLVHSGESERGIRICEESVALAQTTGDTRIVAVTTHTLGIATWYAGQLERSAALNEECLRLYREIGFAGGIAFSLRLLGRVVGELNDPARATGLLEESLAISRELGDRGGIAEVRQNLARVARFAGDPRRAIEMLRTSLPVHRELGERWLISMSLYDLAGVLTEQGTTVCVSPSIHATDAMAVHERLLSGVRLFAVAEALREQCGNALPVPLRRTLDGDLAALHEHLDDALFAQAWGEGRAMSFEQAVEYALKISAPDATESDNASVGGQIGARSTGGQAAGDPELSRLTPREREVAVLVARGLTNRQMADLLVLSERTLDSHVRGILSKLAVTSRAQIAAWVVERGLSRDR